MSREISLMSLVLNWPSYKSSLDEENFWGGLRKHLFGSPTTIQLGKKLCQALEYENSKKTDIFFWWCHDDDVELGRRRVNLGGSMIFILVACESLHIEQQACLHDVERGGMCVVKMVIDMGE